MSHDVALPGAAAPIDEDLAVSSARAAVRRRKLTVTGVRLLLVAVWLGSWELSATYLIDPFYYSKPSAIWGKLVAWFTQTTAFGSIWTQISYTLQEAVAGFALGGVAGVLLGIVLGRSRFVADVLAPFIKAANAIPRIVLASLFVIWFGLGMSSKIATAFILVFFAVFFNAFQGAREVDRGLVNNARILGAGRAQILWTIVVPSATSWILASLHSAFGFAIIGAVVGEYSGADKGLGLLINNAQGTFDSAGIYAGMIIITVIALVAEWLLTLLERRLLRWRPAASGSHDVQI
ncbi:ABC transporter permease [Microtetraspora sp. NBRC 16547]|uniref:ABC transporter permease n=1 Tax=Microtetraspora sp. NBRC 16547 TaxID=3030993 RepID=UPI00249FB700|nr:ABC transporter permease [Microtetraspora sp. NBRC 16547]GLX02017.1 ABC transporter permease [Microtetraspora sp. NBRC 16547]